MPNLQRQQQQQDRTRHPVRHLRGPPDADAKQMEKEAMTPTQRAAMERALEALNDLRGYRQDIDDAIGALVEALAEQPAEQGLSDAARGLIGAMVSELRAHRWCGDCYPEDGWPAVNRVLADYAIFKRRQAAATEAPQPAKPAEQDGLPLVVAGAIFDFAGYMTTRRKVIEVGSTAEAGPVADLVKDWAKLRGLSLDDAAVLSWQEWLPTAPQPAKRVRLTVDEIADIAMQSGAYDEQLLAFARAIEAAHGITGETQ